MTVLLNASRMVGTVWGFLSTVMALEMVPMKELYVSGSIVLRRNIIRVTTSKKLPPKVK